MLALMRMQSSQIKTGDPKMAMEKKSLVGKKTTIPTKSKSTKSKVDTAKPVASKVVAASSLPGRYT
jgi:hypothetical protein